MRETPLPALSWTQQMAALLLHTEESLTLTQILSIHISHAAWCTVATVIWKHATG